MNAPKNALILIDIQNDFLPGGALAVENGHHIIPVVNQVLPLADMVIATKDWHPANHKSFASNHDGKNLYEVVDLNGLDQVLWPDHCIQDSEGAEFAPELNVSRLEKVFHKGTDPEIDSYSGFFDNGQLKSTGMGEFLQQLGITDIYLAGLAQDFCVKYTALDGIGLGFNTWLIEDATRAVNIRPADGDAAIEEMKSAGVRMISSQHMLNPVMGKKYF